MELRPIDQQNAFRANLRVLRHFGWYICEDGKGHAWFYSPETKQWSQQFPLLAILSNDLKQLFTTLLTQSVAKAPPSKNVVHTRLSTPPPRIGPSSSHSSHEAPPPPLGPPPPINNQIHQYSGACVTSSPPPLAISCQLWKICSYLRHLPVRAVRPFL